MHPLLEHRQGSGVRRKRTMIVGLYTGPPPGAVVVCADELGPVVPWTFPPAPAWSPDGHRIKAPLDYRRGPAKTWVHGALRVADGTALTMPPSRNSASCQEFLQKIEDATPGRGDIVVIADNLSSHNSLATRTRPADHLRIRHTFIPVGACRLNLQEAWRRIFRRHALAGVSFAGPADIDHATRIATAQLNQQAKPWTWARPPLAPRRLRRRFVYML